MADMTSAEHGPGGPTPLIVVNPRASRLRDDAQRSAITAQVVAAVRARTGRDPVVEAGSRDAALAALDATARALSADDAAGSEPRSALVVAVGGDGTIRDAATHLAGTSVPLAVVPGGTGNVLASTLRVRSVEDGIRAIRTGPAHTIDLGMARWGTAGSDEPDGESVFLVACGTGLDARIMAATSEEWKHRARFGAYVGAMLGELRRMRHTRYRVIADGRVIEMDAYVALVANAGELIPGLLGPRRSIDPNDGWLDLIVVGGRRRLQALWGATRLMLSPGELDGSDVRRSARHVRIETDPPEPIEVDGDPHGVGWLEASIRPSALSVVRPPT